LARFSPENKQKKRFAPAAFSVNILLSTKEDRMTEETIKKIKEQIAKFRKIRWGWDGDCGAINIIDAIEEIIADEQK
jgi:hypothetical protein